MVGQKVENFILKDENGKDFELYKNLKNKLLLVFYTKNKSSVCTIQLRNYNVNYELFKEAGINIAGVNIDTVENHNNFCSELHLRFPLLSDSDKKVSKYFNALNFLEVNKRILILIDTDKTIKYYETMIPFKYLKADSIIGELKNKNII